MAKPLPGRMHQRTGVLTQIGIMDSQDLLTQRLFLLELPLLLVVAEAAALRVQGSGALLISGGYLTTGSSVLHNNTITVESGTWINNGQMFLSYGNLVINGGVVESNIVQLGSTQNTDVILNGGLLVTSTITAPIGFADLI